MEKKNFYIYQEDLVRYEVNGKEKTISQFVSEINKQYCRSDMKKLMTKRITDYLIAKGYLDKNDRTPTSKGKLLGIKMDEVVDKNGEVREVNFYNVRAQKYLLDNLYEIIDV